jgi:hypothetical protein
MLQALTKVAPAIKVKLRNKRRKLPDRQIQVPVFAAKSPTQKQSKKPPGHIILQVNAHMETVNARSNYRKL